MNTPHATRKTAFARRMFWARWVPVIYWGLMFPLAGLLGALIGVSLGLLFN